MVAQMEKYNKIQRKTMYILIYLVLIIMLMSSIIYIIKYLLSKKEAEEERKILSTIKIDNSEIINQITEKKTKGILKQKTERMLQIEKLQQENSDIVGWLEIANTSINYPVLQGTDDKYYMTHNYKKQKSKNGSIFLSKTMIGVFQVVIC